MPWVGGVVGLGAALSSIFFKGSSTATPSDAVSSPIVTTDTTAAASPVVDTPSLVPSAVGFSNTEDPWGPITSIFGQDVRLFPKKGTHFYSLVEGSDVYTYGVFDLGFGPLTVSDLRIGSRPITDFGSDIAYEIQYGQSSDTAFTIPVGDVTDTPLSVDLPYNTPEISRAGYAETKLSIEIDLPDGIWDTNIFFPDVKEAFTIHFTVEYKEQNDVSWSVTSFTISEFSTTAIRRYFEWAVPAAGIYDVRITKTTGDTFPTGVYLTGATKATWTNLKAWGPADNPFHDVLDAAGSVVYISRIAIKAKGTTELQGVDGGFNLLATRLLRHWNGSTFDDAAATSNPSDIAVEVLTGQANPLPATSDEIDLDSFKSWFDYCVANSFTYRRPIDVVIAIPDLLNEIAAAGRACIENINGRWTAIVDQPTSVISQHFTQRTIIKDSFTATANLGRSPDVILAKFINPDREWQEDQIEVYDVGFDRSTARNPQTISFPGYTDAAQVHKACRFLMATTRLQFWTYTFRVALTHLSCRFGDRVRVTHQVAFAGLGQGRVTQVFTDGSGNITALAIDAPQTMLAGKNYGIYMMPDGANEIHAQVFTNPGTSKLLTLITPIPSSSTNKPVYGNQVAFGELGSETRDCRITEITPAEDYTAQIACVDYDEGIFASDSDPVPQYQTHLSLQRSPVLELSVPRIIAVESGTSALIPSGSRLPASSILITMISEISPVDFFEWQFKPSAASWSDAASHLTLATSNQIRITGVDDGISYDVRIRNRSSNNIVSEWNTSISGLVVIGKTEPPPDVPATLHRLPFSNTIGWYYDAAHGVTVPLDFAGFVIKMAWGTNRNWDQMIVLSPVTTGTQIDLGGLAAGLKTIAVKAIDMSGNEQAGEAAFINIDFGDVIMDNLVYTVPVDLTAVTVTGGAYSSGALRANDDGSLWWGDDLSAPWFPTPLTGDWFDQTYDQMVVEFQYTPPSAEPKPFRVMLDAALSGAYKIEYRVYGQSPWFEDPLTGDWWGDDLSLAWWDDADPQWVPMPDGGLVGDWQTYYFRITFFGGSTQGVLSSLNIVVDVPDLDEFVSDFVVSNTAGSRLTLTNSYRKIEEVRIDLVYSASYPNARTATRLDKSVLGPLIQVLDASNNGTTGIVDVTIKGY